MNKRRLLFLFVIIANLFISVNVYAQTDNINIIDSDAWFRKYNLSDNNIMLSCNDSEEIYTKIYKGLIDLDDNINLRDFNISVNKISDLYFKILADNPRIFYTNGLSYSYNPSTQVVTEIRPKYTHNKFEISSLVDELNNKINKIISFVIKSNMSEFEKERAIHDYIVLNTRYDKENYDNNTIPKDSYNAYGVLIRGTGVCQGYSESMKLLLNEVGIDCIIVLSPKMKHVWNIVTINSKKYHVDITWNDPTPDKKGYVRYTYLNVSDEQMKRDHIWDYDKYPKCTSSDYSHLWDITSPRNVGEYIYYSSNENYKEYIYKLNLKTLERKQITDVRAPYFDIAGEWIYFSNYSNGGCLSKIRLDGTGLDSLNNVHSIDIYRDGNYICYTENDTGIEKKIEIDEESEENYTGYKKWPTITDVPPNKKWTVKFNLAPDKSTVNDEGIYVKDQYGNIFTNIDIDFVDNISVMLTPTKNYASGTYYLYIENLKSKTGKTLKENVKMKFIVK